MTIKERLAEAHREALTETIEDTFGPNPCTSLTLTNKETGEHYKSPCDGKRCVHCGPRKKATIQRQLENGLGEHAYITAYTDITELNRAIERTRKQAQRTGQALLLQSVGDATLGWIIASNHRIDDHSRLSMLSDWMRRILDRYHHSVQRIRRSYALGRVSLVTLRVRKGKSGQASPWYHRTVDTEVTLGMADVSWADMLAESEWREGVLLEYKPNMTLPDPF